MYEGYVSQLYQRYNIFTVAVANVLIEEQPQQVMKVKTLLAFCNKVINYIIGIIS